MILLSSKRFAHQSAQIIIIVSYGDTLQNGDFRFFFQVLRIFRFDDRIWLVAGRKIRSGSSLHCTVSGIQQLLAIHATRQQCASELRLHL